MADLDTILWELEDEDMLDRYVPIGIPRQRSIKKFNRFSRAICLLFPEYVEWLSDYDVEMLNEIMEEIDNGN